MPHDDPQVATRATMMTSATRTSRRRSLQAAPCLCLALACCAMPALAQDEDERSWSLGLALGQGQRDNPLVNGEHIDIHAVIDFSWYGERFFFDNGDLGFTLAADSVWSVNLVATFNNERNYYSYLTGRTLGLDSVLGNGFGSSSLLPGEGAGGNTGSDPRDPNVSGGPVDKNGNVPSGRETPDYLNRNTDLPDRDFAFNGGVELLYISPWGDVQAQVLSDISSTHDGQEAWLSWSRPWFTRSSEFTLTLGLEWKSHQLIGYYYGVRPDEAFAGRERYDGASGTNSFIRLAARHRLGRHWNLVGVVEREFLSSAISASPIVDLDAVDTLFAGLYYQF